MTPRSQSVPSELSRTRAVPVTARVLVGLGWLGGLSVAGSVIGGGMLPSAAAIAATQDDLAQPGAAALEPINPIQPPAPVQSAPTPPAPVRSAPVQSAPVQSAPVQSAPVQNAPVQNAPVAPPTAPKPVAQPSPQPSPAFPTLANPQVPVNTGGNYIDNSDDYNLGATPAPQPPSAIQFSQRGSQCQTVVRPGGGTAGQICGDTGNGPVASGSMAGMTGGGNPGGGAPIRLGSLGAGAQLPDAPLSVRIGPLNLSSQGLSINGHYYFRTSRPNAVQGNGDRGFLFPLTVPSPISSIFGWRHHPILGTTRFHAGTDMSAPLGTPVVAAMSGDVAIANFMGGYGLSVVLSHANGDRKTLYAHLSEVFVKPGDTVKQGEVIGRVGSTGLSTGPHLHFEVRELTPEGWVARNPENFLGQVGPATALLEADPSLNGTLAMLVEAIKAAYLEQYRDAQLQAKR